MAAGVVAICAIVFVVFSIYGADGIVPAVAVIAAAIMIAAAWFFGPNVAAAALLAFAAFAFTCGTQYASSGIQFAPAQIAYFSLLCLMPFSLALSSALSKRVYAPALLTALPGLLLAGFYALFGQGVFSAVEFLSPAFVALFCIIILAPLAALMLWWAKEKR
jgi:hypothetical protein